jgi:hypothetical protein
MPSQGPTQPEAVNIRIGGNLASVAAAPDDVVLPMLRYPQHRFGAGRGEGGLRAVRQRLLYCRDSSGRLVVPAGSVPRIAAELRRLGHPVRIRDLRRYDGPAFEINAPLLEAVGPSEREALLATELHPLGLLAVPPGPSRSRLIGLLCRFWHRAKVLIPCAKIVEARRLAGELGEYVGGNVDAVHKGTWRSGCRVVCCTFHSAHAADPAEWDIVIFARGEQAISVKGGLVRAEFRRHRLYAFIDPGRPRSLRTQRLLEALAGPVIHESPSVLGRKAQVRVLVAHAPWLPEPGTGTILERKRLGFWHNGRRNESVAEIADAFAGGCMLPIWAHGLLLHEAGFPSGRRPKARVAVLVESLEHGRELKRQLSEWPLLDAREPHGRDRRPNPARFRLPPKAIVTMVRADKLRELDTDVLIIASGGNGAMIPAGFPPRAVGGQTRQVLIVDLADDFDPVALEWTRRRLRDYESMGFAMDVSLRWRPADRRGQP